MQKATTKKLKKGTCKCEKAKFVQTNVFLCMKYLMHTSFIARCHNPLLKFGLG